jgi:pimeloyl-ACP methyl ester carboxylesterase
MPEPLPTVLIPGLICTPRLYLEQVAPLWQFGPVTVADHTRDDSISAIARRVLAQAPPRFALAGLSMGGYVAFEIVRQAPDRRIASRSWLCSTRRLAPICRSRRNSGKNKSPWRSRASLPTSRAYYSRVSLPSRTRAIEH